MSDYRQELYDLRQRLAQQGVELTPAQLAQAADGALNRVSYGECRCCGRMAELRYRMCFDCVMGTDDPT